MIFYLFILSAHSLLLDTFSGYLLSSVQFSHSVMSGSLRPHGLQHTRLPCPSPTPQACSNSCPSSQWCHPTISFAVVPSSSHLQSLPESGAFPMSRLFPSGGQSIGTSASASVLPMNIQDWFPLGLTGWISLPSKGLSSSQVPTPQFESTFLDTCKLVHFQVKWTLFCYEMSFFLFSSMSSLKVQFSDIKLVILKNN